MSTSTPTPPVVPQDAQPRDSSAVGPLVWFAALLALNYGVVLARMAQIWVTDDDMSHGVFVPILVGYIVWQRREALLAEPARPCGWGALLMGLGAIMLAIGPPSLLTFTFVTRVAFLFSLFGCVLLLRGVGTIRLLAYPFILMLLMVPLPGFLYERVTLPLQLVASTLSERVLDILGYSVLREGNILHLPRQTLAVVEACSGLRSLLSLTFLGQAYIYLFDARVWMRWAVAAVVIPIAIVANSARILFTAIAGQHNPEWTEGVMHNYAGWLVFVIAFVCLLAAHWFLKMANGWYSARRRASV